MSLVQVEIPDFLLQQAQSLVQHGLVKNIQQLVEELLRRYVESHQETLNEQFIKDDIRWGLYGDE